MSMLETDPMNEHKLRSVIGYRLLFAVLLFASAMTVLSTSVQVYLTYRQAISSIEEDLRTVEEGQVPGIIASLWVMDREQLQKEMEGIKLFPFVEMAEVRSQDKVLCSSGIPRSTRVIERRIPLRYPYRGEPIELGVLSIRVDLNRVDESLKDRVIETLLTQSLVILPVSLFILFIFQLLVTRHLTTIVNHFSNYESGNYSRPLALKRRARPGRTIDELDQVVEAINKMGAKLQTTFDDLAMELEGRRKVQEELMRLHRQNELILNSVGEGIVGLDATGRVTFVNPSALQLLEYGAGEVIGSDFHELAHHHKPEGGPYPITECPMYATLLYGVSSRVRDEVLWRKDGTSFPSAYSCTPIIDHGKITGAVISFRDITVRMQAINALRESEERYRTVVDHLDEGLLIARNHRKILFNRKFVELLGYSDPEQMEGVPLYSRIHPEDRDRVKGYAEMRERGESSPSTYEFRLVRKDGSMAHVEASASVIPYEGLPASLVNFRDITRRKQEEQDRQSLQERLQRAEKMEILGTLAGGVAHDLNNLLGIVVGYSEFLMTEFDEPSSAGTYAKEILKGAERAAAIVQDLLTLTRRGVTTRKVLNLNHVIIDYQKSPEFAKAVSSCPGVRIQNDLEADLLNMSGSSVHLGKSLINLVSNATEAMCAGGVITIKTRNRYLDRPVSGYDEIREGDYVVLSISDTGEGIPSADLKRIFEPFYTKKAMGRSGTGLGLAVVWGTVKDHQGYIDVQSEQGKGTTFDLYLPVTRENISGEEVPASSTEYMGKGESILIVDDVKEQCELAITLLRKLNYNPTAASSGEEAVEFVRSRAFDLIVLDMVMDPGMDGLDTYRKILEVRPHQRAILVSGFAATQRVTNAQALGAGIYLKKPYVSEKLGLAVRKELDR
jgi:PAS domain S-box-containing protein